MPEEQCWHWWALGTEVSGTLAANDGAHRMVDRFRDGFRREPRNQEAHKGRSPSLSVRVKLRDCQWCLAEIVPVSCETFARSRERRAHNQEPSRFLQRSV